MEDTPLDPVVPTPDHYDLLPVPLVTLTLNLHVFSSPPYSAEPSTVLPGPFVGTSTSPAVVVEDYESQRFGYTSGHTILLPHVSCLRFKNYRVLSLA